MMEEKASYLTQSAGSDQSQAVEAAIQRLLDMLGPDRLVDLVEKLSDVAGDPGFGDVVLVFVDGRVRLIKASKSYDWSKY